MKKLQTYDRLTIRRSSAESNDFKLRRRKIKVDDWGARSIKHYPLKVENRHCDVIIRMSFIKI
jgi:hypothetical protein